MDGAEHWWPGGSKEMKDTLPELQKCERKIDLLVEFVNICRDMKAVVSEPIFRVPGFDTDTKNLSDRFQQLFRIWGPVLTQNAKPWVAAGLPVDHDLLAQAACRLKDLVFDFLARVMSDIASMYTSGFKIRRARQLRGMLLDGLKRILDCCSVAKVHGEDLINAASQTVEKSIVLTIDEFEVSGNNMKRADVLQHFEEILRVSSELKSIAQAIAPANSKNTQILEMVNNADTLQNVLYDSCQRLMEHIMKQTQCLAAPSGTPQKSQSHDLVLWLMFGCKFINRVLDMVGQDRVATDEKMKEVLKALQSLEDNLPD
eukprot:m.18616 g.18616  ORF g.18616 m.18616 type:complete len:315 (-) comp8213_c0_seq1:384-1328(-)